MRIMRIITNLAIVLSLSVSVTGQTIEDFNKASGADKVSKGIALAEKMLYSSPQKAAEIARQAYNTAVKTGDKTLMARTSFLNGQVFLKQRDKLGAKTEFNRAKEYAISAGDYAYAMKCFDQLEGLTTNYVEKLAYSKQAVAMYQAAKPGLATSSSAGKNTRETEQLRAQVQALETKISELARERDVLRSAGGDKTLLKQKEEELSRLKAESQKVVTTKDQALASSEQEKIKTEQISSRRQKLIEALSNEKSLDSITNAQLLQERDLVTAKTELQLNRSNNIRNALIALVLGALVLIYLFYRRFLENKKAKQRLEEQNRLTERERERSDDLLHNILPAAIATELKENGKVRARQYDNASVLFTDFLNFTQIAENLTPEELVAELDYCFQGFDNIIKLHQLEKIKTIGDAYMAATGLHERNLLPPVNMIRAAIDIQEFLADYRNDRIKANLPYFQARIGIHTGPLVAGIVGLNKFAYDIWGDTVNIAARLEAACEPGRINISETTYQQVKYNCRCTSRGRIAVKNKGELDMYYVEEILK